MAEITITISGSAFGALRNLPGTLGNAIRGTIEDTNAYVLRQMVTYPPPRPNQRYVRTGTLGRSWSARVTGIGLDSRGVVGSSGNIAPYNRDVQSRAEQGRWFIGRWQTAEGVVEASTRQVQTFADARIRAALAGL